METDEIEMTREELQKYIEDSVNHRLLQTPEIMSKHNQLLLLWGRKEKLYANLYELFETVSKCEEVIKQLYAKLGWEYKALEDGHALNSGSTSKETSKSPSPLYGEPVEDDRCESPVVTKELRVVLSRMSPMNLRPRYVTVQKPPTPELSEDERSLSDYLPSSSSSSDSDFSTSSTREKKKKLRKTENSIIPVQQPPSIVQPSSSAPVSNGAQLVKKETKPLVVTASGNPARSLTNVDEELSVGMNVVARRKAMRWEQGKISEIIEKEDGTKKYKVTFEDKARVLVSGHHLAFDAVPKLVHLVVGGRVVSRSSTEQTSFTPGILAELPSRKNHMRFFIFFDDHQAAYVALPVIRLVCKPLSNVLDDIRDEKHKAFMEEYVQKLPYPSMSQYRVGQSIRVELNGSFEACTVLQIDSSMMEIVFDKTKETEWLYRGSLRLEHVLRTNN